MRIVVKSPEKGKCRVQAMAILAREEGGQCRSGRKEGFGKW